MKKQTEAFVYYGFVHSLMIKLSKDAFGLFFVVWLKDVVWIVDGGRALEKVFVVFAEDVILGTLQSLF